MYTSRKNTGNEKMGVRMALQKVMKQGRKVYVLQFNTCMLNGFRDTLRYNIKGNAATFRAMPTPFYSDGV